MTWARLDDSFHHHPKLMDVSLSAVGLYACGLSYAADNLTDGRLPERWVLGRMVGDDDSAAEQLVEADLWERLGNGAFQIHDFEVYNPTRTQVEERRHRDSERKRREDPNGIRTETESESERNPGSGLGSEVSGLGSGKNHEGSSLSVAREGFDAWLTHYHAVTGRTGVRGSKPARQQFAARLDEGYSLDELKLAIEGCHGDDFCREHGHDVPETILRAQKVTRYIELGKKPAKRSEHPVDRRVRELGELAERQRQEAAA